LLPDPFIAPTVFEGTVQAKVVPATELTKGISVVAPEQIEFETGVAVATGIGLTVSVVVDVKAVPVVGVAVQT
jgi:hypothetical protein